VIKSWEYLWNYLHQEAEISSVTFPVAVGDKSQTSYINKEEYIRKDVENNGCEKVLQENGIILKGLLGGGMFPVVQEDRIEGNFGKVYKGMMGEEEVAVKLLKLRSGEDTKEIVQELSILG
jgi:hypothetical protein